MREPPPIRRLASRLIYENPWMRLREDVIVRPSGEGIYAVVDKPQAGLIVPWDGERLHLVGQWRYTVERESWEFPQGAVHGDEALSGEDVARQELREETGFTAGRMLPLGRFTFAVGMASQWCDAFLACDLVAGEPEPEAEEEGLLRHRAVTTGELEAMIRAGEVFDAPSIAAWGLLLLDEAARAELRR